MTDIAKRTEGNPILTPASGKTKYDGKKTLINGVVVDYMKGK